MGLSTEQTTAVIESTAEAIARTNPDPEPTNYWWLLLIAVIPVILAPFVATWIKRKVKG
jgi:hypothetical protein